MEVDVVVDRLGHAHHADLEPALLNLLGDAERAAHGAVSANDEEHADAERLQVIDHLARVLAPRDEPSMVPPLMVDAIDDVGGERRRIVTEARHHPS